jgi:L-fucose mutarotase
MEVIGAPDELPEAQLAVKAEIGRSAGSSVQIGGLERFAFYEAAKSAFAVVQVGDCRPYGCFLFKKGVLNP